MFIVLSVMRGSWLNQALKTIRQNIILSLG